MAEPQERPTAEEIVLYEKDPETKIATITLDRADDLNAMTVDAQHRYADLVRLAGLDDDVKVLVIRANGPEPRQRRRSARAHGDHGAPRRRRSGDAAHAADPRGRRHPVPAEERLPPRRQQPAVLRRPRRRHAQPAELQEDQHPRGPGLLLRLALLPGGRRGHRPHVGRRAVRPRRVPLRRLRRPHVAVVLDDGRPQVHGDGLHRPARSRPRRCTTATSSTRSCRSTSSSR